MILTIKLDGNWSSFQLANSAPPLSVTDSAIAPSARMHLLWFEGFQIFQNYVKGARSHQVDKYLFFRLAIAARRRFFNFCMDQFLGLGLDVGYGQGKVDVGYGHGTPRHAMKSAFQT